MANKNIDDLPVATVASGKLEILQGGTNKQIDASLLGGSSTTPNLAQVLTEGYTANSSVLLTDGTATELLLDPSYIQLKSLGLGSVLFDADAILDVVNYKGNELATLNDIPSLTGYEQTVNKDATGGYVGLTALKINFKNVLNTFTSFFTNSNTAARTYTFQDRNGTIADDTDLAKKGNSRPIYSGKWRSIPYVGMPVNSTGNQGNIWYIPYIVDSTHIVTDIGLEVTTASAATNIRLALYDDNNGVPGSLIEESAAISSASTGLKTHTFGTPKTLLASNQIYWMAFQCSAFAVGVRVTATAVNNLYITGIGAIGSVYSQSQAFGAFPANATPVNFSSSVSWLLSLKVQ